MTQKQKVGFEKTASGVFDKGTDKPQNPKSQSPLRSSRGFTQPFLPVSQISQAFENVKPLCIELDIGSTERVAKYKEINNNASSRSIDYSHNK